MPGDSCVSSLMARPGRGWGGGCAGRVAYLLMKGSGQVDRIAKKPSNYRVKQSM